MEQNFIASDLDLFSIFRRDVNSIDRLSREEEFDVAKLAKAGNRSAKHRLIESNLGYVLKAAMRYWFPGISKLELVSEGYSGLLIAVQHFDPDRGFRFITYANHWICSCIRLAIDEYCHHKLSSLDSLINSDDDITTFKDTLEAEQRPPEEFIHFQEIRSMLSDLEDRERQVIKMRFWHDLTLAETGRRLGISNEMVRSIETRSLRKMRWANQDTYKVHHRVSVVNHGLAGLKAQENLTTSNLF